MATTLLEAKAETNTAPRSTTPPVSNVIQFPSGLLGFEQLKKFALVGRTQEAPFLWMDGPEDSRISFIVVPPRQLVPDYQPDLADEDVKFLGLKSPNDALVLTIVTISGPRRATINLKGPLVINARTRIGKQVVPVNADDYSSEYLLPVSK
ncbi:MAG TPA: flagellar assembly protein FliW [Verrucomicrobiae bacterium]|nr:flagellar assembly protein FliW [Verrucomicrobiae bacterium]